eukprot:CAMPEP_0115008586 /NCGR_PEP_ID=MMETSP0216-20121206/22024_1 /TAXON_ID=223996 /ORGANISM="Protocruzia adherens, Strain Boccale" /LENGTH=82 /DNA_ID=CAMNT_0002376069 /DNA_START=427 /DNA_END=675 /DNA_ORIENTATION=-
MTYQSVREGVQTHQRDAGSEVPGYPSDTFQENLEGAADEPLDSEKFPNLIPARYDNQTESLIVYRDLRPTSSLNTGTEPDRV